MDASDSFERISGTNGLPGSADGAIILQKKKRTDNEATMQIEGRDQPDQELKPEFNREKYLWELPKAENKIFEVPVNPLIIKVSEFMRDKERWTGSASELLEQMQLEDIRPHILTRKLNVNVSVLFNKYDLEYTVMPRTKDQRCFMLQHWPAEDDIDDAMTLDDAISDTGPGI